MSLINVSNLTFSYDGSEDNIFENTSFQVNSDWKLGFIGRNGRGKTTFLKLLTGGYEYKGVISSSVDFEYFPYHAGEELFTADVIREISPLAEDWEIYRELSLLDVPEETLYRQFRTLSMGEQTKCLLAAMFLRENAFLLIDEPTNHLDAEGRKKAAEYLNRKSGFILVSHDRDFLDACVDHVLSINKCSIEVQKGNFSSWFRNKELQDGFELAENEKLEKSIDKLKKSAARTAGWSDSVEKTKVGTRNSGLRPDRGFIGHKSAKMMKRSKAIEQRRQSAITEQSKLLKNIETADDLKITPLKFHTDKLVQLENVSIGYYEKTVCSGVSFCVEQGKMISLRGKNGCGKSSILKLICGQEIPHAGKIIKNDRLKISYVAQSADILCGSLDDYCDRLEIDGSLFRAILRKLDFSRSQFEKPIETYSGGQKKKVMLAGSLSQQANLYIWDEPLNYIDIFSRIQIENLLLKYRPSLLFVEHDSAFCRKISDETVIIGSNAE